jgi:hypothetical protein
VSSVESRITELETRLAGREEQIAELRAQILLEGTGRVRYRMAMLASDQAADQNELAFWRDHDALWKEQRERTILRKEEEQVWREAER